MTSEDQLRLATRVGAAFLAAGLEVTVHRQAGSQGYAAPAEMVWVVGALLRAGFGFRDVPTSETGPTWTGRPRLVAP